MLPQLFDQYIDFFHKKPPSVIQLNNSSTGLYRYFCKLQFKKDDLCHNFIFKRLFREVMDNMDEL